MSGGTFQVSETIVMIDQQKFQFMDESGSTFKKRDMILPTCDY